MLPYPLDVRGHQISGLVPTDAFKLAGTPLPHPLQRVLETVFMVLAMTIGTAPDASPQLRIRHRVIWPVIGFDTFDLAVCYINPE